MVNYRRNFVKGGCYFFTVNLFDRSQTYLTDYSSELRCAFRDCKKKHSFEINAIVIMPEHLHTIWTLPKNDSDYSNRWRLIKTHFTKKLRKLGIKLTKDRHGAYNVWQKRFWEHTIQNDEDYKAHVDYVHFNPIKHGYVTDLNEWKLSSFIQHVNERKIDKDWGKQYQENQIINFGE